MTAHGGGCYSIHPALPWFFRGLFEQQDIDARERALRAYVEAIASLGNYYHNQYQTGKRNVIGSLKAEELNLLCARALARQFGWWDLVLTAMQGLLSLYRHTGRRAEWARLVEELVPDVTDPATDGPLAGREHAWSFVALYRVWLEVEARRWNEAERLQMVGLDWARRRAREEDRNSIRTLAAALHELGEIQREMGRPGCIGAYRESFDLALRIEDRSAAEVAAFNLGHAYKDLPALRNLDEAEHWYRESLDLTPDGDRMSRAGSLGQLGFVSIERFLEARAAKKPEAVLQHLNEALRWYSEAQEMMPPDAVGELAVAQNQLGAIYNCAGDLDRALHHYREAIRLYEAQGSLYGAATARGNVAIALRDAGRLPDARHYAEAALRDFQTYGPGAAEEVQKTLALISDIAKLATP